MLIRKRKLILHLQCSWLLCVGSSSIGGWIIDAQSAFHFNLDLTVVSLPVLSGHFDTACHQYCVLFSSCWDVLAFEGSSHCLGWPVLLYRKRPQASLNCILVDDNGTVIYRGCHFGPSYAEPHRGENGRGWRKWKCSSHPCLSISLFRSWREPWGPSWPLMTILWSIWGSSQSLIS